MINTSAAYKQQLLDDNASFIIYADITLKNGTVLNLTNKNFWSGGFSIEDTVSESDSFQIGSAIIGKLTMILNNIYDDFSARDFYKAEVRASIGLKLPDGTIEKLKKGVYTVDDPNREEDIITLECLDNMSKFDRPYSESTLTYPATRQAILKDACEKCGVVLKTVTFPGSTSVVQKRPSDDALTFRQVVAWIAQLSCKWARCNVNGELELIWFDSDALMSNDPDDGTYHEIESFSTSPSVSDSDVKITGISVTAKNEDGDEKTKLSGKKGYVLAIEGNDLITESDAETVASSIADKMVGVKFRPLEISCLEDPSIEAGDVIFVKTRKGSTYRSIVTSTTLSLGGYQKISCGAEEPSRNSSTRYSQTTKTYRELHKLIKNEKTARETAIDNLSKILADSSGMYTTYEEQSDGSTITYLHDKPTIVESKNVIKLTSEAIGVSNDGGKTYPYGFVLTGALITKLLYAEGINADYIDTGAFTVKDKDGNVIFQADISGGKVIISADSVRIGDRNVTQAMQEIENSVASARNMTLQLTNQYLSVPVDNSGAYKTFPSDATTRAIVMYGSADITADCAFSVTKSDSITGTWNASTRTYKVTALSADTGWVDIKATYLQTLSVTQRYSVSKLYAGQKGEQGPAGNDGKSYILDTSSTIIKTVTNEFHSPAYIKFSAYCRDGVKSRKTYAGRFKIEETTDGSTWTTVYTSTSDETSVTRSIDYLLADDDGALITDDDGKIIIAAPRQILGMRCTLYAAGGTTTVIDVERIPVVKSVESLSQEEIFNILTNDGVAKGLFMEGNQLYVSFTYARGGMLALGGANNGNGYLYIYDADNNRIGSWTKDGINVTKGTFSGELKAATGTFKGTVTAGNITGSTISGSSFETSNTAGTAKIDIEKATQKFYSNAAFDTYAGEIHPNTTKEMISYTDSNGELIIREEQVSGLDVSANYLFRTLVHGTELLRLRQDRAFIKKFLELTGGLSTTGSGSFSGSLSVGGTETVNGKLTGSKNFEFDGSGLINTIKGSLIVYGDVSQNVTELSNTAADTPVTLAYSPAYASPTLSDVGTGKTGSDGMCYVSIDATLVQAASETAEYVVFLQAEGDGSLYIAEKQTDYFVVRGTPNLAFAWKIEAVKAGTETVRYAEPSLQAEVTDDNTEELEEIASAELPDTEELEDIASQELAAYDAEMEEIENENIEGVSGD